MNVRAGGLKKYFLPLIFLLLASCLAFLPARAASAAGPPVIGLYSPTHPDQNAWYANSNPFFSWSATGLGYSYVLDQNPYTVPDDVVDTYSTLVSVSGVSDGAWYFHLKARDILTGAWGDPASFRVQIDTTGPTVGDLASPTHPDENTVYPSHNPSFSWSSSSVGLLGSCCGSLGGGLGLAVSGNYAYIVDGWNGLRVIDISNPSNPQNAGALDTPGSGMGVAVSGNYAYVADGGSGLRVINVSNPASPQATGFWAPGTRYSQNVAVSGSNAYVADLSNGLQVVDVSNPASPQSLGSINPGVVKDVAISGNYAYLASWYSGFQIVDITNPASPQLKGSVTSGSVGSQGVAVAGNYAYVADTANGLMVIDVSSKTNPVLVSTLRPPGTASSVAVSGNFAYLADGTAGIYVIDISNPASPVVKGSYDTAHTATDVALAGSYAYLADGSSGGLEAFRFVPSGFSYILDQNPSTTPDTTVDSSSVMASYSSIADGTWYFHVRAVDDLGNWGPAVHRKVQIFTDSAAPTTTASGPSGWQTSPFDVLLSCSDSGSGCYRTEYMIDGGTLFVGTTVPIVQNGDHTVEFFSIDNAGNTESPHKTTNAKLDVSAPVVSNITPGGSVSGSHQVIQADLSDPIGGSGVNSGTISVKVDGGAALTGCMTSATHVSCPVSGLTGGSHGVSVGVSDIAGNPTTAAGSFSITGRDYYWTWYDSASMRDWIMMASPAGGDNLGFNLSIGGHTKSLADTFGLGAGVISSGSTLPSSYTGIVDGPVKATSTSGDAAIVSQRSLMGDSFEEVLGTDANKLSDHFYWTWYDQQSSGYLNWIMVANPSDTDKVHAVISFTNSDDTPVSAEADIFPGKNWMPQFGGKMGGPVEVKAYLAGDSTSWPADKRNVIASQRVLSNGGTAFNEVPGIPESDLTSDYLWTWYDQQSAGYLDWVMVANPSASGEVYYQVKLGADVQPVTPQNPGVIAAGGKVTPAFSGKLDGPVEVKSCAVAFDADNCPDVNPPKIIASQRVVAGPSFEEVPGYPQKDLTSDYHWTWYDQQSPGSLNWVMIANPGGTDVTYQIKIAGVVQPTTGVNPGTIAAHDKVTPTFNGKMNGPVEVIANRSVMASQRVTWKGYFNEVLGTVLS